MKIVAVCGMGLGSSLILKMNIVAVLKEMGVSGCEVEHSDLTSVSGLSADLFVASSDLAPSLRTNVPVIALAGIMNKKELKEKLTPFVEGCKS